MPDVQSIVSFLNAIAPAAQALTAIIVAGLTFFLVRTTNRYAKVTGGLLAEAEQTRLAAAQQSSRQILEQEQIRMTTLQPYVRVASATFIINRRQDQNASVFPLFLSLRLRNIGPGPAIGVRVVAQHPQLNVNDHLTSIDLDAHEPTKDVTLEVMSYNQPPPGQMPSSRVKIRAEYRDVFDRCWMTIATVGVEGLQWDIQASPEIKAVLLDQNEEVSEIDGLYIRQDKSETLAMIRTDLYVGKLVQSSSSRNKPKADRPGRE